MSTTASSAPPAAHAAPRSALPRQRLTESRRRQIGAAYLLILPFMVLFLTMIVVPLVYSGYLSFFKARLIGGTSFVGAENYLRALTDPSFLTGVGRMVLFLMVQVPLMLVLSLFSALALDSGMMRLAKFVRLGIFVPYAVPSVIATLMWGYIYGPDFGPIAQIGEAVGLGAPRFFTDTGIFFSIINIVNWEFVGYNMIIMYAALRSIPTELYEAARVDGASRWQSFRAITLPSLKPALVPAIILSVVWTFNMFNIIFLVTAGEPGGSTEILITQAYKLAFEKYRYGYAAAYSTVIFGILVVYGSIQNRLTRATEAA